MTQAMCTSFKRQLFEGGHDFRVDYHAFKMALYTGEVLLGADTTAYNPTGEVESTGYDAGGTYLNNVDPAVSGTTAMVTFGNTPTWMNVTFAASQALIYNVSRGGSAVAVFDFGGSQSVVGGMFTVTLPPFTPTTALLRLI